MRYVRMWYIIRHTKTKIIARVHTCTRHACTRADFFFGMYQLETRFARNISTILTKLGRARSVRPSKQTRLRSQPSAKEGERLVHALDHLRHQLV